MLRTPHSERGGEEDWVLCTPRAKHAMEPLVTHSKSADRLSVSGGDDGEGSAKRKGVEKIFVTQYAGIKIFTGCGKQIFLQEKFRCVRRARTRGISWYSTRVQENGKWGEGGLGDENKGDR